MGKVGYLVLENGTVMEGELIGHPSSAAGEVVFNTSMTGYQEITTDPSYAGQIIIFSYPLIGNCGVNDVSEESPPFMYPELSLEKAMKIRATINRFSRILSF